jgi:formylglycine-generating enzyme required for sulfatase activity
MASEENENRLIISNTGGLIRKMDHQLELMNRVLGEIAERKTEITTGDSFIGMRAGEERDWEIAPGVKMTFCWCPPGDFLMGSPETEEGRCPIYSVIREALMETAATVKGGTDNELQVTVALTKGFWMAKMQVTQVQWKAVMGSNPSYFRGDNLPVETVSWKDTQEFLEKLNAFIGNCDGRKMVLPTEAQWEYACRAGETGPYSGGTIDEVAWYIGNSDAKTHPVATKKANAWGLHDMSGNVREWCQDWFITALSGGVDPTGPSSGRRRVLRGGSWSARADCCRAANRSLSTPSDSNNFIGFRVARSSVP